MVCIIYVNAPIGIGKTSLTQILTKDCGTKGFYEDVENIPMLKEFYSDGNKSRNDLSFALQIAFLNYRFKQLKEGLYLAEHEGMVNTVYDSSLLSDSLMAFNLYKRGEFPKTMFDLYIELNQNMISDVAAHPFNGIPDLIIYLDAPFEVMLDHIKLRGREMETEDPKLVDYYHSVWETYDHWYKGYSQSAVLRIDMNEFDFVNNIEDRNAVLNMIEERLVQLGKLTQAEFEQIKAERAEKFGDPITETTDKEPATE